MSLNTVMDNSLSAMFAAQAGLATTSHNIANADVEGYSRQMNMVEARRPLMFSFGAIGQGVDVATVRRAQDSFLLNTLRAQVAKGAQYGAMDSALYEIENILGSVDNDHLGEALNNFFGAWHELGTAPTVESLKELVVTRGQSLVNDMQSISSSLDDLEDNVDQRIEEEIERLNTLLRQVGDLNSQIMSAEIGGQPANDLRDQRDLLLTDISEIAAVTVAEREDGSLDVILNGRTMVTRSSVQEFTTRLQDTDAGYRIEVVTDGHYHDVQLPEGTLSGLLQSRDEVVGETREKLDEVASLLIGAVNDLHVQGQTGTSTGLLFFTGDSLHTIEVNPMLVENSALVATSRSGEAGDSDIAQAIAALSDSAVPGSNMTVNESYRSVVIDVASQRSGYEFLVDNQTASIQAVEAKIASVTGVSLDEEAASMVRYQNTYNAAARVIATVQEMFDSLINMV
ncbi:flagellar hook-associated protein FlgK [bacterium]|nr:flagellar hook-associated protein FlgK [bacterium]